MPSPWPVLDSQSVFITQAAQAAEQAQAEFRGRIAVVFRELAEIHKYSPEHKVPKLTVVEGKFFLEAVDPPNPASLTS